MNQSVTLKLLIAATLMNIGLLYPVAADAQLTRERVVTNRTVEDVFWGTTNIGIGTVQNMSKNNLKSTVMHTFGLVSEGTEQFWGLDLGANTRLGIDYGISDRVSFGIGRMTFRKIVDIRSKINLLRQTETGNMPIDLAVKVSTGISTLPGTGETISDRSTYFASVMVARKFEELSIQFTPMAARYNNVSNMNESELFGLGILIQYELSRRFAVSGEYLAVFGQRNPGTHDAVAVSLNINTGGHIFQLFFSSSQWHGEQYTMANNRDKFWDGDFRFGFNINRVFGL